MTQRQQEIILTKKSLYSSIEQVKETLYTIFFFYLEAKNEHQFKDLYASQKDEVLSCFRVLEKLFMHTQGHQRVGEISSSNNKIHTTTTAVKGVEHQKPVKSKNGKLNIWF